MNADETIWLVSSGSYSDYRVLCACRTEAEAEAVAVKVRGHVEGWDRDADVEARQIVGSDVELVEVLKHRTTLWDNGKESDTDERTYSRWPFDIYEDTPAVAWRWVRAPIHNGKGGRLEVWGTDHERVRRVYSDKRAELKASPSLSRRQELKGMKR